jgi:hypothetical protein
MDFTELSVLAKRTELNEQLAKADLGGAVVGLRRQRRVARRARLTSALHHVGARLARVPKVIASSVHIGIHRPATRR